MRGVGKRLQALIKDDLLERDAAQIRAAERLDALISRAEKKWRAISRLFGAKDQEEKLGVYLWGGVGRGKTMLMDMLYSEARLREKERWHFHEFMQRVHGRLHALHKEESRDPIALIAEEEAARTRLLCLDEFHVEDIADAEILGRLFSELFRRRVFCAATSNIPPDNLYQGGLNRHRFLPFIALLKRKTEAIALNGETDHRLKRMEGETIYYAGLSQTEAARAMAALFQRLSRGGGEAETLLVQGRALHVPRQSMGTALFSFDGLCGEALGAADYLALARRYHTILLEGVPLFDDRNRNAQRRFITLIDILYDARVKLALSAAAEPNALDKGEEENPLFRRAVSRLYEMRSAAYLAA